eukprot:6442510-Amphidinium_carterae.1
MQPQPLPKGFYDAAARQPQQQSAQDLTQKNRPRLKGRHVQVLAATHSVASPQLRKETTTQSSS